MQRIWLVGRSGIYLNAEFEIENEIIIGRDANMCQLVYPETMGEISGVHCKIQNINGSVCLIDLDSTNGTFLLDGTRLLPDMPRTLESGQGFYLCSRDNAFDIIIKDDGTLGVVQDYGSSERNEVRQQSGGVSEATQKKVDASFNHHAGVCPKCGCANCQAINETNTTGKDFSASKACCGAVLLGPIGIICGACGGGKKVQNTAYWVCPKCGNKFKV